MPNETSPAASHPLWLLAELTYACPLQCVYCSNPLELGRASRELDTETWLRVLREGRAIGATQLGFSGGEPLLRHDLETLVAEGRKLGYYTNLITSSVGMDEKRVKALRAAGLDHIQISFQAGNAELSDLIAGTQAFEHKLAMARAVKAAGYPMVLNFVLHRKNIENLPEMLALAETLEADYVELANTQYYGWALANREHLLPTRAQLEQAEAIANATRERLEGRMKIYYIVPDYYENRPKACMGGWGAIFLTISPDGTALPCQGARQLPGIEFPNVREHSIAEIWRESDAFNRFRGFDWMREPCRSCPERFKDFGGCRCQAFQLTGDAANTDPVCDKSPNRHLVDAAIERANRVAASKDAPTAPLYHRNPRTGKLLSGQQGKPHE